MSWFTRRRSSKPFLMNLTRPLLKCQDTKIKIQVILSFSNFYFFLSSCFLYQKIVTHLFFNLFSSLYPHPSVTVVFLQATLCSNQIFNNSIIWSKSSEKKKCIFLLPPIFLFFCKKLLVCWASDRLTFHPSKAAISINKLHPKSRPI